MDWGFVEASVTPVIRILVAGLLGGLIGLERDVHGRAAGLRTHLLVSMGAGLFMVLSEIISSLHFGKEGVAQVLTDPGRIAAQIVTGIGFLGAGAILKDGLTVRGLTTAACLWIVAAIGMAAGAGLYVIAGATTLLALFALVVLKSVERLYPKDIYRTLTVETPNDFEVSKLVETLTQLSIHVLFVDFHRDYQSGTTTTTLSIRLFQRGSRKVLLWNVVSALEAAGIPLRSVKWEH